MSGAVRQIHRPGEVADRLKAGARRGGAPVAKRPWPKDDLFVPERVIAAAGSALGASLLGIRGGDEGAGAGQSGNRAAIMPTQRPQTASGLDLSPGSTGHTFRTS